MKDAVSSLMGIRTTTGIYNSFSTDYCILLACSKLVICTKWMAITLCWLVGKNRAIDAALNAMQSPLLDIGIERASEFEISISCCSVLDFHIINSRYTSCSERCIWWKGLHCTKHAKNSKNKVLVWYLHTAQRSRNLHQAFISLTSPFH